MKTILLADDNATLRRLLRVVLESPQYRVLEACDGAAALELARQEHVDLLVLDWLMPVLTGIQVAQALRQDPATAHVPIIIVTGKGHMAEQQEAEAVGACMYLVKPFSPLELWRKVSEILETGGRTQGYTDGVL